MEQSAPRPHIKALTGLRFVAALLVVAFHWLPTPVTPGGGLLHTITAAVSDFVDSGSAGVDFFFVLSGFILAYTYLCDDGKSRTSARDFWIARVARVYPVYVVIMVAALAPYLILRHGSPVSPLCTDPPLPVEGLLRVLLLQAWAPCGQLGWDGPSWTLSAEAFFYLCFPLLAAGAARLSCRRLLAVAVLCWTALASVARLYDVAAPHGGYPASSPWLLWEYTNPLLHLPEFVLGLTLGLLFLRRRGHAPAVYSFLSIVVGVAVLCVLTIAGQASDRWIGVISLPAFAVLIWCLAFGRGPLAAFFASRPLVALGEASYALYLLHVPLREIMAFPPVINVLGNLHLDGPFSFFTAYFLIALGLSILVNRYIETPARRAIRARFTSRRPRPPVLQPMTGDATISTSGAAR